MDGKVGTSCWGWTLRALALFGVLLAFAYLLGSFDTGTVVTTIG